MKKNKQKISCDVASCKHNDQHDKICELDQIMVTEQTKAEEKQDTVCDSFKKE